MPERRTKRKIRVLLAKFDLESHDRGLYLISKMLQNAGMEIVLHIFQKTEELVKIAAQEDVDVIGLTTSSGDTHMIFFPEIIEHLKKEGMGSILVIGGGRIFGEEAQALLEKGVAGIFGPGSQREEIIDFIEQNVDLV